MENEKFTYSVPLFHNKEQEGLRLLELPPDLLAAFESSSAPSLTIKSAPPPEASHLGRSGADHQEAYHAVICTSDQTYQLKQVQTSNSIFLLQPRSAAQSAAVKGLCAFATCSSTLETSLLKTIDPVKQRNAIEWLEEILPPYLLDTTTHANLSRRGETSRSKKDVIQDVPYSQSECEHAWTQLAAFEASDGSSFRPTAKAALEVWRSLFTIHEASSDLPAMEQVEVMREQALQELNCPPELVDAVLSIVLATPLHAEGNIPFDKENTLKFVSQFLLESESYTKVSDDETEGRAGVANFEERLCDSVPELWKSQINTEHTAALKSAHEEQQTRRAARARAIAETAGGVSSTTGAKRTLPPGKRDWHERLKRNKK